MSKTLYIMRGWPGSGKSTLARKLQPDGDLICSADDFHIDSGGVYRWTPAKVPHAHSYCQNKCKMLMMNGDTPIVIDNTNIKKKDFQVYLDIAEHWGYTVVYVESDAPWRNDLQQCAQRNTHNVPLETIERMMKQYEPVA